tara:strand:- start:54 stop:425 length:372 start_codon:yes stop_codon:yes gene_type:complete
MKNNDIVEMFLEDYFGHDLFDTLEKEEINEAITCLNELTRTVNEYFNINEDNTSEPGEKTTGRLGDRFGHTQRGAESSDVVKDLHRALNRRGMKGISPEEMHKVVMSLGIRGSGSSSKNEDED